MDVRDYRAIQSCRLLQKFRRNLSTYSEQTQHLYHESNQWKDAAVGIPSMGTCLTMSSFNSRYLIHFRFKKFRYLVKTVINKKHINY